MKTIQDAVVELGGKLPKPSTSPVQGGYFIEGNKIYTEEVKLLCAIADFETEAKRIGYINGYRWGVEYPTNGKRPELPLDTKVCGIDSDDVDFGVYELRHLDFSFVKSFKITDPRYKPADTSYLGAVSEATESNPEDESASGWYDYDKQVAVALPDASSECQYTIGSNFGGFKNCYFIGKNSRGSLVIESADGEFKCYHNHQINFRPLDWSRKQDQERREFVEKAVQTIDKKASWADALFDAGCRFTENKAP